MTAAAELRFVVLTGLSGAGKTTALHALEDVGFFTVDNLPPSLWTALLSKMAGRETVGVVVGVDIRAGSFLPEAATGLDALRREGCEPVVVFLDATDETLVKRFNFTRRTHPISEGTLSADIAAERTALEPLRSLADIVLDTTSLSARELIQAVWQRLGHEDDFTLRLLSFGFKRGMPMDADTVLDVRTLPNPYYDPNLRALPGTDPAVQAYVFTPEGLELYSEFRKLVRILATRAQAAGRSSYTVAIGCTGGQHRSVAVAERMHLDLADTLVSLSVHRDVDQAVKEHRAPPAGEADDAHRDPGTSS